MPRNLRNLRKRLGKCRGICAACANVSVSAAELARLAQTSRQMPQYLRGLRKRLGKCHGTCATCANVSANAAELARLAQTSRQMPRNLRSLRKRLGKCREPRATCANVSANTGSLAQPAQTWGRWGAYAVAPLQPDDKDRHGLYEIQPIDLRPNKQSHQTNNESWM